MYRQSRPGHQEAEEKREGEEKVTRGDRRTRSIHTGNIHFQALSRRSKGGIEAFGKTRRVRKETRQEAEEKGSGERTREEES